MSDNHVDKDKIVHIDYNEILSSSVHGALIGAAAGVSISGALTSLIRSKLKNLQKSKPTWIEIVRETFKSGKEHGLSEMELEIDNPIVVGADVKGLEGTELSIGIKTNGRIILKAKYK